MTRRNGPPTPVNEQQNPVKYMRLFGQPAHAHGLKVIMAPSLDLACVSGSVLPASARRDRQPVVHAGQHRRGGRRRR